MEYLNKNTGMDRRKILKFTVHLCLCRIEDEKIDVEEYLEK